jgi:hypothetical protein
MLNAFILVGVYSSRLIFFHNGVEVNDMMMMMMMMEGKKGAVLAKMRVIRVFGVSCNIVSHD